MNGGGKTSKYTVMTKELIHALQKCEQIGLNFDAKMKSRGALQSRIHSHTGFT
jgi:hypothetical protein